MSLPCPIWAQHDDKERLVEFAGTLKDTRTRRAPRLAATKQALLVSDTSAEPDRFSVRWWALGASWLIPPRAKSA